MFQFGENRLINEWSMIEPVDVYFVGRLYQNWQEKIRFSIMFFALKTYLWSYTPFYPISSLSTFLSLHILKKNAGRMLVSTELSVQVSIVNLDEDDLCTKLFLIEDNTGRRRYVSPPNPVGIITLYTYGCKILFSWSFRRQQRIFKTARPQTFFPHLRSHVYHRWRRSSSNFSNWMWNEHERNATSSFV